MARIHVISAGEPSWTKPPVAVVEAKRSDAFDKHNKPRIRRSIILSALRKKYPDLVSFTNLVGDESQSLMPCCDLVDLYQRVHDENMIQFLVEAWSKWKSMGPPWDEDNCHPEWVKDKEKASGDGDGNMAKEDGNIPPLIPTHSAFRHNRNDGSERPSSNVMGAIGYYCTDFITPIVGSLVRELQEDAHIICSAVDIAFSSLGDKNKNNSDGGVVVYALTTHPGHHASRDCFGGYCYLNNAALCARLMQRCLETGKNIINKDGTIASNHWNDGESTNSQQGETTNKENKCRIAIIDIDYHCGNGTASIFYQDPTIFFTSIHCDPTIEYPWNSGYNDQIGEGEGMGTTLHIPLPPGTTWEGSYKLALEKAMHAIVQFDPAVLVISLGLDTYEGDSVAVKRGGFCLKGGDYYEMGRCMGTILRRAGTDGISGSSSSIPCVFVQEGGYKMDTVGDAAADVVGGFAASISQQGSPL